MPVRIRVRVTGSSEPPPAEGAELGAAEGAELAPAPGFPQPASIPASIPAARNSASILFFI